MKLASNENSWGCAPAVLSALVITLVAGGDVSLFYDWSPDGTQLATGDADIASLPDPATLPARWSAPFMMQASASRPSTSIRR